jgi:hypothetical protein
MPKLRSSRRAPGLKDSDYDHEIGLIDHDPPLAIASAETTEIGRSSSGSALSPQGEASSSSQAIQRPGLTSQRDNGRPPSSASRTERRGRGPSIEIQGGLDVV